MKQYIVDAFAERVFHGNPAAVCLMRTWLPDAVMQAIAMENNLSETVFAVGAGGEYHLRWFTPANEIDFCGHATVAAAFVVANFTLDAPQKMIFHTLSGDFQADVKGNEIVMDFPAYRWKEIPVTDAMTLAIGVRPSQALLARDLLLVVETAEQVREMQPDVAKLKELPGLCRAVTAAGDGEPYDCVSRVFAPELGAPEDPVTGSVHCLIAPYWAGRLGKDSILAYQDSARGGLLRCHVMGDRVEIAAKAVLFAIADIYPKGYTLYGRQEMVSVRLEPEGVVQEMPRPKTAGQLLTALGLAEETALVARDGKLLTPDRSLWPGDELLVRKAGSRG